MAKTTPAPNVQEFYVQPSNAEENRVIGLEMNACQMPEEDFFYRWLEGSENLWRCSQAKAKSFKQRLPNIRVLSRRITGIGDGRLKDVTDKLS